MPETSNDDPLNGQLESWKEIAAYLGRSVRTVRRWETTEALPVHRHRHERGSSVIAYRSELDQWKRRRLDVGRRQADESAVDEISSGDENAPSPRRRPRRRTVLIAAIVLASATLVLWLHLPARRFSAGDERSQYRVLLCPTENRVSDYISEALFNPVLERELSGSSFRPVSDGEIAATLSFMRRDGSVSIDPGLSWEISRRHGGISGVVTSRLERSASGYLMAVEILHPASGESLASVREVVRQIDGINPALRRVAEQVRRELSVHIPAVQLSAVGTEKVTTSSSNAWELYTEASTLMERGAASAAEALLDDAIDDDPEFASAYSRLAWVRRRMGQPSSSYVRAAEDGRSLATTVSEHERLLIEGTYHHVSQRFDVADQVYETLLRQYPDSYWAVRQALDLCEERREVGCSPFRLKLAKLRPDDVRWRFEVARGLVVEEDDADAAEAYIERARERLTLENAMSDPDAAASMATFKVALRWLMKDPEGALKEASRVESDFGDWPPTVRDAVARKLGFLFLVLGRAGDAEHCFREISDFSSRDESIAYLLFMDRKPELLKQHLEHGSIDDREPFVVVMLAAMGLLSEAEARLARLESSDASPSDQRFAKSVLAIARREPALLMVDSELPRDESHPGFFPVWKMLADSLHERGESERAIHLLEMTTARRASAVFAGTGFFWVQCQYDLADYYRQAGRVDDARNIESELLSLLSQADEDFPVLGELISKG